MGAHQHKLLSGVDPFLSSEFLYADGHCSTQMTERTFIWCRLDTRHQNDIWLIVYRFYSVRDELEQHSVLFSSAATVHFIVIRPDFVHHKGVVT